MVVTRTARPIDLGHLVGVRWKDGICDLHHGHVVREDYPYHSIRKFYACFYACYVQDTPTVSLDAQELMVFLSSLQLVRPLLLHAKAITARRRPSVKEFDRLGNGAVGPLLRQGRRLHLPILFRGGVLSRDLITESVVFPAQPFALLLQRRQIPVFLCQLVLQFADLTGLARLRKLG